MSLAVSTVPTVSGTLVLAIRSGSTVCDVTVDNGNGPVTVGLTQLGNLNLVTDTSSIMAAMREDIGATAAVVAEEGVIGFLFVPSGLADPTFDLTVDDMRGRSATVRLNQGSAKSLLFAAARMIAYL